MNSSRRKPRSRSIREIVPIILRVAFSVILWTLGATVMTVAGAQPKQHRVVHMLEVDRNKAENLQRWVNGGHDGWCRDAQLVAAAALRRVSPDFPDYELASLPLDVERSGKNSAVYSFHSLDGHRAYRITLRRYRWLLPVAGSLQRTIWIPERVEILTRDTMD